MGNNQNKPIGVFDSGLGGLTVVKELMRVMPNEHIVYFGDTARVPYGTKSKDSIIQFSRENTGILLKHDVKMVVVACNSSSSYALDVLKDEFSVPVVGVIEAGAKKAVAATRNKKIGIVATSATIASRSYEKAILTADRTVKVFTRACPMFVPLVEEGWLNKGVTVSIAEEYLKALKKEGVDTLILGCTHYPLLKLTLKKVMGKSVTLIDSAKEIAYDVKDILAGAGQCRLKRGAHARFLISDRPQEFKRIARQFMGKEIKVESVKL
jgi:glutamate racemase